MTFTNIRPVSAEVQASVLAEWRAFAPMLEANERPADNGSKAARMRAQLATANVASEVATTVRVLGAMGHDPQEIARVTALGAHRVRAILGISEDAEW